MKSRGDLCFVPLALAVLLALGCAAEDPVETAPDDDLWARANLIFKPLPQAAPSGDNPVTLAKVGLGKRLYFDTRLSKSGKLSCDSCHDLESYGVDNLPTSPGDAGRHGDRNSPTVLNAALHVAQFWDGRAEDVEQQAGMPVLNPVEMAIPGEDYLVARLTEDPDYREAFAEAFPEQEDPLTFTNVRHALAAFERTLLTPSRFDDFLRGDIAFSDDERQGLEIFMRLGCSACHNGATVGGHIFRKFGIAEPYWELTGSEEVDDGRFNVTGEEQDRCVFKVPSLRNVEKTYPYFHDGSVATLEEALRVMARLQIGAQLSEGQVAYLATFLKTLTGELPAEALEAALEYG
jgi:cytochrome c peroxidase